MTNNGRCLNYNRGRPNAPVRFYPACGKVVINDISAEVCKEEKQARKRREHSTYCADCGEQLIQ